MQGVQATTLSEGYKTQQVVVDSVCPRFTPFISGHEALQLFRSAPYAGESEDGDLDELREDIAKRSLVLAKFVPELPE